MILTREEQDQLLRVAREAIAQAIGVDDGNRGRLLPDPASARPIESCLRIGAFVSIHLEKDLRGCIGYPESDLPLVDVIRHCSISAATSDPRFPALKPSEWPRVSIEISVLGPIQPVTVLSEIEIGRHGLIAQLGHRRGLLLPQVAADWGWERREFAGHTCRKAGLPADAWRTGAQLFKFEAQVFGDP